jgi:hypothetical protein
MLHPKASPPERRAGRSIYERIQRELDPRLKGDIVAVEAVSGEFFVGPTIGEAAAAARARHPDRPLHFFRLGFLSVYVWR